MAVLGLVFGGGGVAAVMKARYDRAQGVAALEVTEDDAISARWASMIDAQTKSLVQPLRDRLTEVEGAVKTLEAELRAQRTKYWRAVAYVRTLLNWIKVHTQNAHEPVPTAPAEIAEDL